MWYPLALDPGWVQPLGPGRLPLPDAGYLPLAKPQSPLLPLAGTEGTELTGWLCGVSAKLAMVTSLTRLVTSLQTAP